MAKKAIRTTLPDGKIAISNIIDKYTGESIQLVKIDSLPVGVSVDDVIYFETNTASHGVEYWKRVINNGEVNIKWFGATNDQDISTILTHIVTTYKNINIVLEPSTTYTMSGEVELSDCGIIGNGSTIKLLGPGVIGFKITNTKSKEFKDFILDLNNTPSNLKNCGIMVTGNVEGCVFDNIHFINVSSATNIPSTSPLYLISKDVEDDYSQGNIGYVRNNTFKNLKFRQVPGYKSQFLIRVITNWDKGRPTEDTINKSEFNVFDSIDIEGDYLWNMVEFAGTGTTNNTIKNSRLVGRAITAIDFDKGASYNICDNNYVELSLSSYHEDSASPFVFAAISNKGHSSGILNKGNIISNNRLNDCGRDHINQTPLEACIGLQRCTGGEVMGNTIINTHNAVCGIHLYGEVTDTEITHNITNNIASRAITSNANQGGNFRNIISKNILESNNQVILLAGSSGGEANGDNIISDNKLTVINTATGGIFVAAPWDNTIIRNNRIYNNGGDKVISNALNTIIDGNYFDGPSNYSVRVTGTGIITNNISLVSTNGIVGSASETYRRWNNSWDSYPVPSSPYFRNDNTQLSQNANTIPPDFWKSTRGITITTISSGTGYPNSQGIIISFQNGGGASPTNYNRSFDIFKAFSGGDLYVRGYNTSGEPQAFKRLLTEDDL